ncbi:MAG: hypothetical protein A3E01_08140 [Gammaproteobacteria bacterium RIFCSPHIGHO2_12_FULL_63_22]|nr:MAG: hypothetical protein A3E01_08140 [Gammaproteobacteria bacterium RIFCSPHIGHO2_12_FULL_63_22]
MAETTGIAWTNATWNPVRGCERVSEGCKKCYAEVLAARHSYKGGWGEGLAKYVTRPDGTKEARWTGVLKPVEKMIDAPLRWKKPRRVFVNSMSDLFHDKIRDAYIDLVFAVMAIAKQHTFQILTKRPERMQTYMVGLARSYNRLEAAARDICYTLKYEDIPLVRWPIQNVWLGVSAEDQDTFDQRVELLGRTPAAMRFVSAEPFLGDIDIGNAFDDTDGEPTSKYGKLDWAIIGGESGSDYRPMDIEAARAFIQQVKLMGGAMFVKQDSGPRPGMRGRFTDAEWALKEYPA